MKTDTDVLVIGGGVAGLTAAVEAAALGAKVSLYEAHAGLGGRARTRQVKGFAFNQGPHALYRAGAFHRALERFRIPYGAAAPPLKGGLALTRGRAPLLPFWPDTIARTGLLSGPQRAEITAAFGSLMGGAPPHGNEALGPYFDRLGFSGAVRGALEALVRVTTYCHAPETAHAGAMLDQIRLGFAGVLYLDGGWRVLADGLAARARALGAEIVAGAQAEAVTPHDAGATVRFADGTERSAGAVILAVGPGEARDLAPRLAALRRAAERARPIRMACLDLGLSGLPAPRRLYDLGVRQPHYYSVHSAAARLAPPGAAMIHVARYLAPGETPGRTVIAELEGIVDRLQPGWRPLEKARQQLPAIVVAHDHPQAALGGLAGRPAVQLPETPRLFIAGDWVGPEGLLSDAAAASGLAAAQAAATLARPC